MKSKQANRLMLPLILSLLNAVSASAAPELERPQLRQRKDGNLEYVAADFKKIFKERPSECREFLTLVEGKAEGSVSIQDKTKLNMFNTFGMLIAKKSGEVLYERYYQGFKPSNKMKVFSVSKMFSVLSYGALEAQGLLNSDLQVSSFLKANVESRTKIAYPYWDKLKISHLLTMGTGIPWCEYTNCVGRDGIGISVKPGREDAVTYYFENVKRGASDVNPVSEPGSRYIYSAGNAVLLQGIMKVALKDKYLSSPSDLVMSKLNVDPKEYSFEQDQQGVFLGGSGLFINLPTMAKLGLVLLNGGSYGPHQIANTSFVDKMTKEVLEPLRNSKDKVLKAWEGPTGMGVWLNQDSDKELPSFMPDVPNNMIYSSGLQGRRLMMFPEAGDDAFIVARLGTENSHSSFWQPYSKSLYKCLGQHPELTPNNRGSQVGIEPATEPPVVSTKEQEKIASIDFIKRNVPIQMAATELCHCAFVSRMAKIQTNGKIDQVETLKTCLNFARPDFSVIPWPFNPKFNAKRVQFSVSPKGKSVAVRLVTSPLTQYTAVATLKNENSVAESCELTVVPKPSLVPSGLLSFIFDFLK